DGDGSTVSSLNPRRRSQEPSRSSTTRERTWPQCASGPCVASCGPPGTSGSTTALARSAARPNRCRRCFGASSCSSRSSSISPSGPVVALCSLARGACSSLSTPRAGTVLCLVEPARSHECELSAVLTVELAHEPGHVLFDGGLAEVEAAADCGIGCSR